MTGSYRENMGSESVPQKVDMGAVGAERCPKSAKEHIPIKKKTVQDKWLSIFECRGTPIIAKQTLFNELVKFIPTTRGYT